MEKKLEAAIKKCILAMTDEELTDLEMRGGRFYACGTKKKPLVRVSQGPCDERIYHEGIDHLISIPWEADQFLELDEETGDCISNTPDFIRSNLLNLIENILVDFLHSDKFDSDSFPHKFDTSCT